MPASPRARAGLLFAACVPGLAPLLRAELAAVDGVAVTGTGDDGRSGLVFVSAATASHRALLRSRLAEDVFVEVARTGAPAGTPAAQVAAALWPPGATDRALSLLAAAGRPLRAATTYRVVVRVRQERGFLRTELRRRLTAAVAAARPRWRTADPAALEVWALEYEPGRYVSGLRLSDAGMRAHAGRSVERAGALRPTVAAAMVQLAGPVTGGAGGASGGVLLDPCCGAGTVLAEAAAVGWTVRGGDIDREAVRATAANVSDVNVPDVNVPGVAVSVADARRLDLPDGSVDACASNLPFGRQFQVQGDRRAWLRDVVAEMSRVTRPGGRVVLLAPDLSAQVVPSQLQLTARHSLAVRGMRTVLQAYVKVSR